MSSSDLKKRLHDLAVRAAQLQGAQKADSQRSEQLTQDVALAKGRMGLAEEVSRVFNALQLRAHERSVGAFERLLTAILSDVLPEEGAIRLLPEFKNNDTWLDIALQKGDALEDVYDGNGGAVTNVVCAGLRFAALSRTDNRRLMVLDEPDCWLKPERVPAFVGVIADVSAQTNTQTFFITHHYSQEFEGRVNLVQFKAGKGEKVVAEALAPLVREWQDDVAPGIRSIELVNVRRHVHTVVPCFPGATAYIGDNNLGKSTAVVTALKAVAYGESDDSLIRHGTEEARIVLHIEGGRRVEWSRALKRSPSVLYRLYEGDTLVTEGRPKARNQAPEWVTDILGVARVDDLDIQIGNQKSPVFLLNDSAPKRARILSVGRESSHLKVLMRAWEETRASDRETAKQGELALAKLKVRLKYLERLPEASDALESLRQQVEGFVSQLEAFEKLQRLVQQLDERESRVQALHQEAVVLGKLPQPVELRPLDSLESIIARLQRGKTYSAIPSLPSMPVAPELKELSGLVTTGKKLAQSLQRVKACEGLPATLPTAPVLHDSTPLLAVSDRVHKSLTNEKVLLKEYNEAVEQEKTAQVALTSLVEELGGLCPLCGSIYEGHQHETH